MKWYEMSWSKQRRKKGWLQMLDKTLPVAIQNVVFVMVPLHCDITTQYIAINCYKRVFLL
jgi:hypothetical protein